MSACTCPRTILLQLMRTIQGMPCGILLSSRLGGYAALSVPYLLGIKLTEHQLFAKKACNWPGSEHFAYHALQTIRLR